MKMQVDFVLSHKTFAEILCTSTMLHFSCLVVQRHLVSPII